MLTAIDSQRAMERVLIGCASLFLVAGCAGNQRLLYMGTMPASIKSGSYTDEPTGLTVVNLTDAVRKKFKIRADMTGVLVTEVNDSAPHPEHKAVFARRISRGDVISRVSVTFAHIGTNNVFTVSDFRKALELSRSSDVALKQDGYFMYSPSIPRRMHAFVLGSVKGKAGKSWADILVTEGDVSQPYEILGKVHETYSREWLVGNSLEDLERKVASAAIAQYGNVVDGVINARYQDPNGITGVFGIAIHFKQRSGRADSISFKEKLRKLNADKTEGVISAAEYEQIKKHLLEQ